MEQKKKRTYERPWIRILGRKDADAFPEGRDSEYEYCVLCHRETDVKKTEPVGRRRHYVEGEGQLCPDCARRLSQE